MKNIKAKSVSYIFLAILLTIGLSLSLQSLVLAWSPPTKTPPDDNVNPPIFNDSGDISLPMTNHFLTVNNNFAVGLDRFYVNESTGRVGVGTITPSTKFEVVGGPIKASGGLIIETRANDPSAPVDGQIWLIN